MFIFCPSDFLYLNLSLFVLTFFRVFFCSFPTPCSLVQASWFLISPADRVPDLAKCDRIIQRPGWQYYSTLLQSLHVAILLYCKVLTSLYIVVSCTGWQDYCTILYSLHCKLFCTVLYRLARLLYCTQYIEHYPVLSCTGWQDYCRYKNWDEQDLMATALAGGGAGSKKELNMSCVDCPMAKLPNSPPPPSKKQSYIFILIQFLLCSFILPNIFFFWQPWTACV